MQTLFKLAYSLIVAILFVLFVIPEAETRGEGATARGRAMRARYPRASRTTSTSLSPLPDRHTKTMLSGERVLASSAA